MNIVCCTDHKYIMPTGIMMFSLSANNVYDDITYHVICKRDVTLCDRDKLRSTIIKYNHKIVFYEISEEIGECFTVGKEGQPKHITISAYYRLLLTSVLPDNIDKVLYLDGDIIVNGSIKELYNIDLNGVAIGVVPDMSEGAVAPYRRLKYSSKDGYFNTGVCLINLRYWRDNNILSDFIEFASQFPERVVFHDQDIMNYVLRHRKLNLPIKYNIQHGFLFKEPDVSWEYDEEIASAIASPIIIHYTAADKPWYLSCSHPFKSIFLMYKNRSVWKDIPLINNSPRKSIKSLIKQIMYSLGIIQRPVVFNPYREINHI